MPGELNISNTVVSDYKHTVTDVTVASKNTDGISDISETIWSNPNWTKYYGYFDAIPDLQSALLMKSAWNVGKGYLTDVDTQKILDHITGYGKESFKDILFNMDVTRYINGDSYAQIMWDEETGRIPINIKVLNPSSISVVFTPKGRIKEYRQTTRLGEGEEVKTYQPREIWHMTNARVADQTHGISKIAALERTILADNENFEDLKTIMHHQAIPFIIWLLKTDNPTKIAAFKTKIQEARKAGGEDAFIPDDDDTVKHEVVQLNLSPQIFEWRNDLRNKFYRNIGLPQIVPGAGGQSTESESKSIYFSFEQLVQIEQGYLEDQIWNQLGLRINLIPPSTMAADLQGDSGKDGGMAPQPSDTTAGSGR